MTITRTFRLPSDPVQVPSLRDVFVRDCADAGIELGEVQGPMLVFTELVNNGIEHGAASPSERPACRYTITPDGVALEIPVR